MPDIQRELLSAIDIITEEKLNRLDIDKTVEMRIEDDSEWKDGVYIVSYQNLRLTATSNTGAARFYKGDMVYVFIPKGDFSNDKVIVARVNSEGQKFIDLESIADRVNRVGANFVIEEEGFSKTLTPNEDRYDVAFDREGMIRNYANKEKIYLGATVSSYLENTPGADFGFAIHVQYESDETGEVVDHVYRLNLAHMTGNPYRLNGAGQYRIFSLVEGINITQIKDVYLYMRGFSDSRDQITFSELEVRYALAREDMKFSGNISAPFGTTFDPEENEHINMFDDFSNIILTMDILNDSKPFNSPDVEYLWFYQDRKVFDEDSEGYHEIAGEGWHYLDLSKDRIVIKANGTIHKVESPGDDYTVFQHGSGQPKSIAISVDAVPNTDIFKCIALIKEPEIEGLTEELKEQHEPIIYTISAQIEIFGNLLRENIPYNNVKVSRTYGLEVFDRRDRQRVQLGNYARDRYGMVLTDATGTTTIIDDQGMMQSWQEGVLENLSEEHPLTLSLYIPPEVTHVHRCLLSFNIEPFRSYSSVSSSEFSQFNTEELNTQHDTRIQDIACEVLDVLSGGSIHPAFFQEEYTGIQRNVDASFRPYYDPDDPNANDQGYVWEDDPHLNQVAAQLYPLPDDPNEPNRVHNHGIGFFGTTQLWCRHAKDWEQGQTTPDTTTHTITIPSRTVSVSDADGKTSTGQVSETTATLTLGGNGYWREFVPSGNHIHQDHDHMHSLINHYHVVRPERHDHSIDPDIVEFREREIAQYEIDEETGEIWFKTAIIDNRAHEDYSTPYWEFELDENGKYIERDPEEIRDIIVDIFPARSAQWWYFSEEQYTDEKGDIVKIHPWIRTSVYDGVRMLRVREKQGRLRQLEWMLYKAEKIYQLELLTQMVPVNPHIQVIVNDIPANEYLGKELDSEGNPLPFTMFEDMGIRDADISGLLNIGEWNSITFHSNDWARIDAKAFVQAFTTIPRKSVIRDNTYVETFQMSSSVGIGDVGQVAVAAQQTSIWRGPSFMYRAGMVNNQGSVDFLDWRGLHGWQRGFSVGEVKGMTLAFDAHWENDEELNKWRIVTEEEPWVFWIDQSSVLWGQKYNDFSTRIQLGVDVAKVEAVRGWKSVATTENDHGIVVAYIKNNGFLHYRNYCQYLDENMVKSRWRDEEILSVFGGNLRDVRLFITNDYRLGISVTNTSGHSTWRMTPRNWGGMAIRADRIHGVVDAGVRFLRVSYSSNNFHSERLSSEIQASVSMFYAAANYEIKEIRNVVSTTDLHLEDYGAIIEMKLNHPLYNVAATDFAIRDERYVQFPAISAQLSETDPSIVRIQVSNFNNARGEMHVYCSGQSSRNEADTLHPLPFEKSFMPVGLQPVEIPAPKLVDAWNESKNV